MEQPTSNNPDHGAAARALLGDELTAPPSATPPLAAAVDESSTEIPPAPLPELALEFGPDVPAIQWGAAWCLVTGLVWALLALAGFLLPGWLDNELAQYLTAAILLGTAVAQLNGLSYLKRIDPIHRAREYLTLSWFLMTVMTVVSVMAFLVYKFHRDGNLTVTFIMISWLTGVGSFWSILFGLRRVAIYVAELRVVTAAQLCQILLGFLFAASLIKFCMLLQLRRIRWLVELLPDSLLQSIDTLSPTLLATAGVVLLLYVYCLWLLWRACGRAQQQSTLKRG